MRCLRRFQKGIITVIDLCAFRNYDSKTHVKEFKQREKKFVGFAFEKFAV